MKAKVNQSQIRVRLGISGLCLVVHSPLERWWAGLVEEQEIFVTRELPVGVGAGLGDSM